MAVIGETQGVHANVIQRLEDISQKLGKPVTIIKNGGKRHGPVDDSAHNSGIAADITIENMLSVAIADELVDAGFSGVGEYYRDAAGTQQTNTAHGDIRGLPGSENSGAYAPGGAKHSKRCWHRLAGTYNPGRKSGHRCPQDG